MPCCNNLLFHEGFVSCQRIAGITDWLISLYHQSLGQPLSPGDLAYRQQVKQTGNYCVTFRPGCSWTLIFVSFLCPSFFQALFPLCIRLFCYFKLYISLCHLEFTMSSLSRVILKFEFALYMRNTVFFEKYLFLFYDLSLLTFQAKLFHVSQR